MTDINAEILIVGAGVCGLMAAQVLKKEGLEVLLVDKGRSVGGRLATRRIGPGRADHGAQFFTVRSPEFHTWVENWQAEGLVFRWSHGWSDGSLDQAKPDGYPRYAVTGGMNALAKHLAQDLDVPVNVKLTSVTARANGWRLASENGKIYTTHILVMTPPVPQSLALLKAGNTQLSNTDDIALKRITYAPCIAGLFWVEGPVYLPAPGAIQRPKAPITWVANNQQKGISPDATLITVHAGPDYSRELWSAPPVEALSLLEREGLEPFLDSTTLIKETQLKRWRYALPVALHPNRCLVASNLPPLIFAGDAFGEARVEGAALSGMDAASKVLTIKAVVKND